MHIDLTGRTALVTGAGSRRGIGRATALALAASGAAVACFDLDRTGVRKTADAIRRTGGRALALPGDASRARDVDRAVAAVVKAWGRLDLLVNNAAVATLKPALDLSEAEWDRMMTVNLKGYFLFCRAAGRRMVAQGAGSIVNISSISATLSGDHKVGYSASKAGINLLTRGLALELGRHGVRVNSVSPGAIATDIVKDARLRAVFSRIPPHERTPLGRAGTGADVAPAVVFLASEHAAFITGADLLVDGGLTAGQRLPPGGAAQRGRS